MRKVDEGVLYHSNLETWIKIEKGTAYIGLTDWAQTVIGSISSIHFEFEKGRRIVQNGLLFEIESDKSISEIVSPITGYLYQVNEEIQTNPSIINNNSYWPNWVVAINNYDVDQIKEFLPSTDYKHSIDSFFRKS